MFWKVHSKCGLIFVVIVMDIIRQLNGNTLTDTLKIAQDSVTRSLCTLKTDGLIEHYGYAPEKHSVTTDDGYILTVFRCNSKKLSTKKKKVVILQHGLLSSSDDFCVNVPNQGLAYVMADAGYDVWIQNNRGNFYSRKHISKDPDNRTSEFWDFSWDDIGLHDYPAVYDYVRAYTNTSKLYAIGHSQGTTATMALLSLKPEYNDYMHAVSHLAPVSYLSHADIPWSFFSSITPTLEAFRNTEFLPRTVELNNALAKFCSNNMNVCNSLLDFVSGPSNYQRNDTMLPSFLCHFPSGSAFNQFLHYMKQLRYGFFGRKMTGLKIPPDFPLSQITVPTSLHYSTVDKLTDPRDVKRLIRKLNNTSDLYVQIVDQVKFAHVDFILSIHTDMIYSEILKFFAKHE